MATFEEFDAGITAIHKEKMVWTQEVTWNDRPVQQSFTFDPDVTLETIKEHLKKLNIDFRPEAQGSVKNKDGETVWYVRLYCTHRYRKRTVPKKRGRERKGKGGKEKQGKEKEKMNKRKKRKPQLATAKRAQDPQKSCLWCLNLKKKGREGWTVSFHVNVHRHHFDVGSLVRQSSRVGMAEDIEIVKQITDLPPEIIQRIDEMYKAMCPTFVVKQILGDLGYNVTTRILANVRNRYEMIAPEEFQKKKSTNEVNNKKFILY